MLIVRIGKPHSFKIGGYQVQIELFAYSATSGVSFEIVMDLMTEKYLLVIQRLTSSKDLCNVCKVFLSKIFSDLFTRELKALNTV